MTHVPNDSRGRAYRVSSSLPSSPSHGAGSPSHGEERFLQPSKTIFVLPHDADGARAEPPPPVGGAASGTRAPQRLTGPLLLHRVRVFAWLVLQGLPYSLIPLASVLLVVWLPTFLPWAAKWRVDTIAAEPVVVPNPGILRHELERIPSTLGLQLCLCIFVLAFAPLSFGRSLAVLLTALALTVVHKVCGDVDRGGVWGGGAFRGNGRRCGSPHA